MAYADYKNCDICDTKAFYDASLNYDFEDYPLTGLYNLGDWKTICIACSKTYEVVINKKVII